MQRLIIASILFSLSIILVLKIHRLSPTNLAGPGFDLPVYLLAVIGSLLILARHVGTSVNKKEVTSYSLVNIVGSTTILVIIVYNFFQ